ncbi:MAG: LamG-like jellyroll fold domain-containing protein, partial [Gammaproteobacteria bacterium]
MKSIQHNRILRQLWQCLLLVLVCVPVQAAVTVTPASGGGAISADTAAAAPGTGAWTTLTGPVISEEGVGDIGTGTIILNAPAGYEFNTAAGTTVLVTWTGGGPGASNRNINDVASGTSLGTLITSNQITFTVTDSTSQGARNSLTWQNIQVRPTQGCPIAASGNITRSGTSTISGTVDNLGTLTEVTGNALNIYTVLDGQSYGGCANKVTGTPTNPLGFTGSLFTLGSLRVTDRFGNVVTTYNSSTTINYSLSPANPVTVTPNPVTFSSGVSSTLSATINDPETYTLTASATGLTGISSSAFVVTAGTAAVTTPASGGGAISSDTAAAAPGNGSFTSLTGPVIDETNTAGMAVGSYTLSAPAGFEFDTGTNVTIAISAASGTGTNLVLNSTSVTPTASTITFNVSTMSSGTRLSRLTFSNVRVRPLSGCPMAATGNIVFAADPVNTSVTNNNAGTLAQVAGNASHIYTVLTGQSWDGCTDKVTGTPDNPLGQVNTPFSLGSLRVTDQFGNTSTGFNSSIAITYTLDPVAGGSSFTSPVTFSAGVSTTTLTTTLTASGGYTITSSSTGLSGVTSDPFNIVSAILRASYRMDEFNWTGTAGEVIDSSGNDLHGTAVNGITTSNLNPAINSNPGTCHYGVFDGVDDYVQVGHDALLNMTTALTIGVWINPASLPGSGLMTILSKDDNYEFHLKPSGVVNWWWSNSSAEIREFDSTVAISTSDTSGPAGNGWHHVAIVYSQTGQTIYINGVASGTASFTSETLINNTGPLLIGADVGPMRFFDGLIDEVNIFQGAMSGAEVVDLMNQTRPCITATVDHYAISYPSGDPGSTCAPSVVQITAHDSFHSLVEVPAGIELTASASAGNWGGLVAGTGSWTNGGSAVETYTWPGNESSFQVHLSRLTAGSVNIDVVDTFGETEDPGEDPSISFAATSLRITDVAGAAAVAIDTQIAGKRSDEPPAPQSGNLFIQAFGCDATIDSITNLQMAFECNNPGSCAAGSQVAILEDGGNMQAISAYADGTATPDTL